MRHALRRTLPLLVLCAMLPACSKGSTSASATPGASVAQNPPPIKPLPAELPDVLAKVNGESITKVQFEQAVQAIEQRNGQSVPADQRDGVYRGVLDQLIGYRLLIQETKSRNVTVTDAEVDQRIAEIKGQFPSEQAFTQTLAQQGTNPEQLRTDARSELLVRKMLQAEIEPKVSVTPQQIQDYYDKNLDRFKQGERVRASHILFRVAAQANQATKDAVKAKATDVLKQARAGKDFAALAKQYSEDPGSAVSGGDLNYFRKGQMVPQFDQTVFAMKVGDISDLVETQFGFHIIKLVDKQADQAIPLDQVRPQVQQFLENQSRQEHTQELIKSLAAKSKVEILV